MVAVPPALPSIKSVTSMPVRETSPGAASSHSSFPSVFGVAGFSTAPAAPVAKEKIFLAGARLAEDEPEPERVGIAHEVVRDGRAGRLQVERDEPERVLVDAELDGSAHVRAGRHGRVGKQRRQQRVHRRRERDAAEQPPVS